MTDFYMRVDRPENRHVWRFLDSDADGSEVQVEVSIPRREWIPQDTFDKGDKWSEENPKASLNELMLFLVSIHDPEGHKWLKANRKKIPLSALGQMWTEFNTGGEMSQGESEASTSS